MRAVIYCIGGTERTSHIAAAMRDGFSRHGKNVDVRRVFRGVEGDIAIAYGWNHESVFAAYRAAGASYAYWDMGYWDRRPVGDKKNGLHRLAVNDWDTRATMRRNCPDDRFRVTRTASPLSPWGSRGDQLVLAGMSGKAAGTHRFKPGQWEAETDALVRSMSKRPIVHREKPAGERPTGEPIEAVLSRSHMVISHHSNTAVDALIAGVPFFARKGVGAIMSPPELTPEFIEHPPEISLSVRVDLLSDIAYAQWRPSEMRQGIAWEHIKCILNSL